MGIMMIASIVTIAAFTAARGDIKPSAANSNRKVAYAAAEAGVAWYMSKLTANPDYWQLCDTGSSSGTPDPVNQPNATVGARKWKRVPGSPAVGSNVADFSIAMLPASGATCSTATPSSSMLNSADGSFKIRSTGRFHGQLRTIVTKFAQQRFLNFIYFTDYETLDPLAGNPGGAGCAQYRASRPSGCTVIQFTDKDKVNGPLHTNDDLVYCGAPVFGRPGGTDNIEVSGPSPGYYKNGGCTAAGTPAWNTPSGALQTATRQLQMPPTNATLKTLVSATNPPAGVVPTTGGYLLSGTQYIRFTNDGNMVVDTPGAGNNPVKIALPQNGVIFVQNGTGSCNDTQNPTSPYTYPDVANAQCANVYVSGQADKDVTLASDKDIIVAPTLPYVGTDQTKQFNPQAPLTSDADLIAGTASNTDPTKGDQVSGPVQIGLIATNFVRVYHPVSSDGSANASSVRDVRIDAAILSLQHSFIVDNYNRGTPTGTLTVHGAIAQRFRGPVGTSSGGTGAPATGYLKDYTYDNRLRYQSPPYFINPLNEAWGIGRETELVPPV
jgi:hypothetical protein